MDPNISLVFETIGQIKKSLQCSICLELLNDPHSTKCNHQFCSHCIKKVIDERRNVQKEALCPLCKNPVTKRSLTANPRLKEIVDVVRRLNSTFKEDAGLPDSPYPLVNSKTRQEPSKSYLQFLSSHPTPQKPAKGKRLPSIGINGCPTNSPCASESTQQITSPPRRSSGQVPGDVGSKSLSPPTRGMGPEILDLLETNEGESVREKGNEDADISSSNGNHILSSNGNIVNENNSKSNVVSDVESSQHGDAQTPTSQKTTNCENLSASSSSTAEMIKSSQASSLTCRSVSLLECLTFSETEAEEKLPTKADSVCADNESAFREDAGFTTSNEDNNADKNHVRTQDSNVEVISNCVRDNGLNRGSLGLRLKKRSQRNDPPVSPKTTLTGDAIRNVAGHFPNSLNHDSNADEAVQLENLSELIPASIESNSSTSGPIRIPRCPEFVSEDEISFKLSSPGMKTVCDGDDNHGPEMVECSFASSHPMLSQNDTSIHNTKAANEQVTCKSPTRRLSAPSSGDFADSEAMFLSPSKSSGSQRCKVAKRKYNDVGENVRRKCRRLNQANDRKFDRCKNKKDRVNEIDTEEECLDDISNADVKTCSYESSGTTYCLPDCKKLCSTVLDEQTYDETNKHLNIPPRKTFQRVKTAENDTEDEIVPPTPPVHVEFENVSPPETENYIKNMSGQSRNTQDENTRKAKEISRDHVNDQAFSLDDSQEDQVSDDEDESVVTKQVDNPMEDLSCSEDDLQEPFDQDNIGLLRRLGPASHKESENETDDDISDCRTADTTSVSSLNEGDCMDLEESSQRIQYLHKVLAETGGEIEKLTADLKTLRRSDRSVQQIENLDDSENSENEEDDDEKKSSCSISPPPSPEPSALALTKIPPAIKDMQMLLQDDSDSDSEAPLPSQKQLCYAGKSNVGKDDCQEARSLNMNTNTTTQHVRPVGRVDDWRGHSVMPRENSEKENDSNRSRCPGVHHNSKDVANVSKNKTNCTKSKPETPEKVLAERKSNVSSKTNVSIANFFNHDDRDSRMGTLAISERTKVSFVVTRLPKQFVSLAGYLAKRYGGKLTGDLSTETTHIIMPTDSQMYTSRKNYTIKYLLGIALGKWIVSQLWLTSCAKAGRFVDEKPYEVKGDPEAAQAHVPNLARTTRESKSSPLFDGISVICFGDFSGAISKVHITQLVQFCGGQVISSKQEAVRKKIPDLVIVIDPAIPKETELLIKDICETYNTYPVSAEWVTDSVANYQLQDIEEYRVDC